jgi:hypothetical protein
MIEPRYNKGYSDRRDVDGVLLVLVRQIRVSVGMEDECALSYG